MRIPLTIGLAAAVLTYANPAKSGVLGDNLTPYLALSGWEDDNLFRSDDQEASQQSREARVGIRGTFERGRQLVNFDLSQGRHRFDDSNLDYSAFNGEGSWLWRIGKHVSTRVSAERKESLTGFNFFQVPDGDVLTRTQGQFDLTVQANSFTRLTGRFRRFELEHSERSRRALTEHANEVQLNLLFRSGAGTYLGVGASRVNGEYPDREFTSASLVDNGYVQNRYGLVASWDPSADTNLRLRVGRAERNQDHLSARNFDAPYWSLSWSWNASAKLRFTADVLRDIQSIDNPTSSIAEVDRLNVDLYYQPRQRWQFGFGLTFQRQNLQPVLENFEIDAPDDKQFTGSFNVDYTIADPVTVGFSVVSGDRSSNLSDRDFEFLKLQLSLELRL